MQSELKTCYLLIKRGLYYAPDRHGYTGVKARAGRYREVDALGLDGVTAIHEDAADEFSPACWPDTKEAVLRSELARLTEALRAAEEREKALREALGPIQTARNASQGKPHADA